MACDWTTERKRSCEKIDKVIVVSGSRGLQKTDLHDLQLGVVM